jgi:hypothetical protein
MGRVRRAALVMGGDDILGGARHVHNEANARIEVAWMRFNLGDDPARLRLASRG